MITQKTVFILGAGASAPYGYPTGAGLKDMICDGLGDLLDELVPNAKSIGVSWEEANIKALKENFAAFKNRYCGSPIPLIDSFIARNPDISEEGRRLISLCVLAAEKNSRFLREIQEPERQFDWYYLLFNIMVDTLEEPGSYVDFKKNEVAFITFNYDRSLEYYLYDALKNTFGEIDLRKYKPVDLIPFKFIHVYGKIDNFPWEEPEGLEYKSNYSIRDILRVAGNIKLIHERNDEFLDDIKETIIKAKNIFFLGFGYDEDNMTALGWPEVFVRGVEKRIFGTAFNRPERRRIEIEEMLQKGFLRKDLKFDKLLIDSSDCCFLLQRCRDSLYE